MNSAIQLSGSSITIVILKKDHGTTRTYPWRRISVFSKSLPVHVLKIFYIELRRGTGRFDLRDL